MNELSKTNLFLINDQAVTENVSSVPSALLNSMHADKEEKAVSVLEFIVKTRTRKAACFCL